MEMIEKIEDDWFPGRIGILFNPKIKFDTRILLVQIKK